MPSGLAARNGGRVGLALLAAVLLLGLGLRVGYAWDGRAPVYDAAAYAAIAGNLEEGEGFTVGAAATQPSGNYSPGLPLVVAGVYFVAGGVDERLARVVLAVLGSLAVLFTYLMGRRLGGAVASPPDRPPGLGVVGDRAGSTEVGVGSGEGPGRSMNFPHPGVVDSSSVVAGLVGALGVAIYPAFLEYGGMLMSEGLAATLLSGGVLALFWAWDAERARAAASGVESATSGAGSPGSAPATWSRWLLAGLALGALALVRPEYLGVGALLALVVLLSALIHRPPTPQSPTPPQKVTHRATNHIRRSGWARWLGAAALVLAGMAVVILPWTVRNVVALDRVVPISTGGGQVLFAGTYMPSDGDPEKVGAGVVTENPKLFGPRAAERLRLEQILARLAGATYPGLETDQALSRMGREQLWDELGDNPVGYAGFVATKVGRIWSHGPRAVMREPVWEALHWVLLGFGLLGLGVLAWRRRWEALVIATVFLAITALSALLVASPRRVLVMLPLLAACAGFAATWIWTEARRRLRPEAAPSRPDAASVGDPDSLSRP